MLKRNPKLERRLQDAIIASQSLKYPQKISFYEYDAHFSSEKINRAHETDDIEEKYLISSIGIDPHKPKSFDNLKNDLKYMRCLNEEKSKNYQNNMVYGKNETDDYQIRKVDRFMRGVSQVSERKNFSQTDQFHSSERFSSVCYECEISSRIEELTLDYEKLLSFVRSQKTKDHFSEYWSEFEKILAEINHLKGLPQNSGHTWKNFEKSKLLKRSLSYSSRFLQEKTNHGSRPENIPGSQCERLENPQYHISKHLSPEYCQESSSDYFFDIHEFQNKISDLKEKHRKGRIPQKTYYLHTNDLNANMCLNTTNRSGNSNCRAGKSYCSRSVNMQSDTQTSEMNFANESNKIKLFKKNSHTKWRIQTRGPEIKFLDLIELSRRCHKHSNLSNFHHIQRSLSFENLPRLHFQYQKKNGFGDSHLSYGSRPKNISNQIFSKRFQVKKEREKCAPKRSRSFEFSFRCENEKKNVLSALYPKNKSTLYRLNKKNGSPRGSKFEFVSDPTQPFEKDTTLFLRSPQSHSLNTSSSQKKVQLNDHANIEHRSEQADSTMRKYPQRSNFDSLKAFSKVYKSFFGSSKVLTGRRPVILSSSFHNGDIISKGNKKIANIESLVNHNRVDKSLEYKYTLEDPRNFRKLSSMRKFLESHSGKNLFEDNIEGHLYDKDRHFRFLNVNGSPRPVSKNLKTHPGDLNRLTRNFLKTKIPSSNNYLRENLIQLRIDTKSEDQKTFCDSNYQKSRFEERFPLAESRQHKFETKNLGVSYIHDQKHTNKFSVFDGPFQSYSVEENISPVTQSSFTAKNKKYFGPYDGLKVDSADHLSLNELFDPSQSRYFEINEYFKTQNGAKAENEASLTSYTSKNTDYKEQSGNLNLQKDTDLKKKVNFGLDVDSEMTKSPPKFQVVPEKSRLDINHVDCGIDMPKSASMNLDGEAQMIQNSKTTKKNPRKPRLRVNRIHNDPDPHSSVLSKTIITIHDPDNSKSHVQNIKESESFEINDDTIMDRCSVSKMTTRADLSPTKAVSEYHRGKKDETLLENTPLQAPFSNIQLEISGNSADNNSDSLDQKVSFVPLNCLRCKKYQICTNRFHFSDLKVSCDTKEDRHLVITQKYYKEGHLCKNSKDQNYCSDNNERFTKDSATLSSLGKRLNEKACSNTKNFLNNIPIKRVIAEKSINNPTNPLISQKKHPKSHLKPFFLDRNEFYDVSSSLNNISADCNDLKETQIHILESSTSVQSQKDKTRKLKLEDEVLHPKDENSILLTKNKSKYENNSLFAISIPSSILKPTNEVKIQEQDTDENDELYEDNFKQSALNKLLWERDFHGHASMSIGSAQKTSLNTDQIRDRTVDSSSRLDSNDKTLNNPYSECLEINCGPDLVLDQDLDNPMGDDPALIKGNLKTTFNHKKENVPRKKFQNSTHIISNIDRKNGRSDSVKTIINFWLANNYLKEANEDNISGFEKGKSKISPSFFDLCCIMERDKIINRHITRKKSEMHSFINSFREVRSPATIKCIKDDISVASLILSELELQSNSEEELIMNQQKFRTKNNTQYRHVSHESLKNDKNLTKNGNCDQKNDKNLTKNENCDQKNDFTPMKQLRTVNHAINPGNKFISNPNLDIYEVHKKNPSGYQMKSSDLSSFLNEAPNNLERRAICKERYTQNIEKRNIHNKSTDSHHTENITHSFYDVSLTPIMKKFAHMKKSSSNSPSNNTDKKKSNHTVIENKSSKGHDQSLKINSFQNFFFPISENADNVSESEIVHTVLIPENENSHSGFITQRVVSNPLKSPNSQNLSIFTKKPDPIHIYDQKELIGISDDECSRKYSLNSIMNQCTDVLGKNTSLTDKKLSEKKIDRDIIFHKSNHSKISKQIKRLSSKSGSSNSDLDTKIDHESFRSHAQTPVEDKLRAKIQNKNHLSPRTKQADKNSSYTHECNDVSKKYSLNDILFCNNSKVRETSVFSKKEYEDSISDTKASDIYNKKFIRLSNNIPDQKNESGLYKLSDILDLNKNSDENLVNEVITTKKTQNISTNSNDEKNQKAGFSKQFENCAEARGFTSSKPRKYQQKGNTKVFFDNMSTYTPKKSFRTAFYNRYSTRNDTQYDLTDCLNILYSGPKEQNSAVTDFKCDSIQDSDFDCSSKKYQNFTPTCPQSIAQNGFEVSNHREDSYFDHEEAQNLASATKKLLSENETLSPNKIAKNESVINVSFPKSIEHAEGRTRHYVDTINIKKQSNNASIDENKKTVSWNVNENKNLFKNHNNDTLVDLERTLDYSLSDILIKNSNKLNNLQEFCSHNDSKSLQEEKQGKKTNSYDISDKEIDLANKNSSQVMKESLNNYELKKTPDYSFSDVLQQKISEKWQTLSGDQSIFSDSVELYDTLICYLFLIYTELSKDKPEIEVDQFFQGILDLVSEKKSINDERYFVQPWKQIIENLFSKSFEFPNGDRTSNYLCDNLKNEDGVQKTFLNRYETIQGFETVSKRNDNNPTSILNPMAKKSSNRQRTPKNYNKTKDNIKNILDLNDSEISLEGQYKSELLSTNDIFCRKSSFEGSFDMSDKGNEHKNNSNRDFTRSNEYICDHMSDYKIVSENTFNHSTNEIKHQKGSLSICNTMKENHQKRNIVNYEDSNTTIHSEEVEHFKQLFLKFLEKNKERIDERLLLENISAEISEFKKLKAILRKENPDDSKSEEYMRPFQKSQIESGQICCNQIESKNSVTDLEKSECALFKEKLSKQNAFKDGSDSTVCDPFQKVVKSTLRERIFSASNHETTTDSNFTIVNREDTLKESPNSLEKLKTDVLEDSTHHLVMNQNEYQDTVARSEKNYKKAHMSETHITSLEKGISNRSAQNMSVLNDDFTNSDESNTILHLPSESNRFMPYFNGTIHQVDYTHVGESTHERHQSLSNSTENPNDSKYIESFCHCDRISKQNLSLDSNYTQNSEHLTDAHQKLNYENNSFSSVNNQDEDQIPSVKNQQEEQQNCEVINTFNTQCELKISNLMGEISEIDSNNSHIISSNEKSKQFVCNNDLLLNLANKKPENNVHPSDDPKINAENTEKTPIEATNPNINGSSTDGTGKILGMQETEIKVQHDQEIDINQLEEYEKLISTLRRQISSLTEKNMENERKSDILSEQLRVKSALFDMLETILRNSEKKEKIAQKDKIEKELYRMEIIKLENRILIAESVLKELEGVLAQGSLEGDIRFIEKMEKLLIDIDKFETPRFFKISVQLEIAKKYVKDIIYLKKKNLLRRYFDFNE